MIGNILDQRMRESFNGGLQVITLIRFIYAQFAYYRIRLTCAEFRGHNLSFYRPLLRCLLDHILPHVVQPFCFLRRLYIDLVDAIRRQDTHARHGYIAIPMPLPTERERSIKGAFPFEHGSEWPTLVCRSRLFQCIKDLARFCDFPKRYKELRW